MANKNKLSFKDIISSDKPVLVDFYATWCGPCKALSPVITEVKNELGNSMRVIKVDVDKKKSISNKYKIKSLPTLAIFHKGEMLWRESGMKSKAELIRITNQYIEKTTKTKSKKSTNSTTAHKEGTETIEKKSWIGRLFGKS